MYMALQKPMGTFFRLLLKHLGLTKAQQNLRDLSSRQGVRFPMTEDVSVIDQETGNACSLMMAKQLAKL